MNRLQLAKYLLDVSQQAVKMKERLLKDQLRTATAREVHLKQWGAVERDLTDAMAELIHRQFASASKTISEEGKTKFDPRDWDDDLIDSALPILMKHAGQAAAAQMLMMGVDVAPKKRRKTEKGDLPGHPFRGNQWTGGQGSSGSVMDHLSEENRKAFFDVAGYEQDDFDKLVEAIETGDSKTFNLYREDDGVVDAIEIAVWRSKGVKPFDGDGIDPKKLTGDDAGPGFGPFQRAGIMGDVADEGMTWVSPTRVYAENYQTGSREVRPYAANVKKPLDLRKLSGTDDLDPEDVSSLLADHGIDIPASRMRAGEIHQVIESVAVELREKAIKAGFDSIVQNENYDGQPQQTLVVFHGRDLKLLTNPKEKSPSFFRTKASRATDWLLSLQDEDEDLSALWPEVFSLPGGGAVDLAFATEWPAWMKAEISKQMKETFEQPFWAGINDTTAKGIEAHVLKGLEDGLSIREIRESMVGDGLNEYYRNRGINIARTESGSALNGARSAAMDRLQEEVPGLKVKRTWMSVLGTTTRDSHAHLDGVPADRDGEWYLGGVKVPWPGHWRLPPSERCNCFPAGTLVSGRFNGAQMARYDGTFAKIITRSGAELSLTPNHPVVTSKGLVAAGMLKPGDQVACYRSKPDSLLVRDLIREGRLASNQVQNEPALIENVFEAIAAFGHVETVGAVVGDFYGDGKSIDGDICIVRTDGKLLEHSEIASSEKVDHGVLALSEIDGLVFEFGEGRPGKRFRRFRHVSPGDPSLSEKLLRDGPSVWRISPSGSLSIGVAADFDTSLKDSTSKEGSGIPSFLRESLERHPGSVAFDDIVEVRNFDASCHVYDLQSEFGTVMASDPVYTDNREILYIISSNCQCTLVQSWGMPDSEAEQLIDDYNRRLAEERAARDFWTKHLAGQHNQADHGRGGSVLQSHVSEMISHLETIFKGPGRAAAVNEVLSAAKFPEYLRGILQEVPGADEIRAVVEWSVRRGRMWEAA